ncbi:hypothetical protein [Caballeronia sp. J97]|uniref:hypothetical protein n=1 Tax=Caballeronia sp. J97 TaxID=2805429 RepID=UPI002AB00735|nr:hypothetical protein [Caballeronia sp. J97]
MRKGIAPFGVSQLSITSRKVFLVTSITISRFGHPLQMRLSLHSSCDPPQPSVNGADQPVPYFDCTTRQVNEHHERSSRERMFD